MILVVVSGALLGGAFLVWWLIFETEGVYLGKRVVVALYDLYAGRYDRIKQFDDYADFVLLSQPLLERIAPKSTPLILDVACGTGRLPLIMARDAAFKGHVLGLDASRRMLELARRKVAAEHVDEFISLVRGDAMDLPLPDQSVDAASCLEALEFMPDPARALAEMIRVLRPGGLLLTTIRIGTRWMPGRAWSETRMRRELERLGMVDVQVKIWQEDYSQVWALKPDASPRGQSKSPLPPARKPAKIRQRATPRHSQEETI